MAGYHKACLFLLLFLGLSCLFAVASNVSLTKGDFPDVANFTCAEVKNASSEQLTGCSVRSLNASVVCQVLLTIVNGSYLNTSLEFVAVSTNGSRSASKTPCVALRNISVSYVETNSTAIGQVFNTSGFLHPFQEAIADLSVWMPFRWEQPIPIGTTDLANCTWNTGKPCNVVVNVASRVWFPKKKNGTFTPKEILKELYIDVLGGVVAEFNASLNDDGSSRQLVQVLGGLGIEKMSLPSSYFQHFTSKFFKNMVNLRRLSLVHCSIDFFTVDHGDVPQLEFLDLSVNRLGESMDMSMDVAKYDSLRVLHLRANRFTNVTLAHLPLPKYLETLDISQNNIGVLGEYTIPRGLIQLRLLNCSACNVHWVDKNAFKAFSTLHIIDISWNYIKTLSPITFRDLRELKLINASYNGLEVVPNLELNALDTLDISWNMLPSPVNVISRGNITYFDLSWNKLVDWYSHSIFSHPGESYVQILNMSNNKISTITSRMGQSLEGINVVDLGGNPIDCDDCSTLQFQEWLHEQPKGRILINGRSSKVLCLTPEKWIGKNIMEVKFGFGVCYDTIPYFVGLGILCLIFLVLMIASTFVLYRQQMGQATQRRSRHPWRSIDAFIFSCANDIRWVDDTLVPIIEKDRRGFRVFRFNASDLRRPVDSWMSEINNVIFAMSRSFMNDQQCLDAWNRAMDLCQQYDINTIVVKLSPDVGVEQGNFPLHHIVTLPRNPDDHALQLDAVTAMMRARQDGGDHDGDGNRPRRRFFGRYFLLRNNYD